MSLILEALRKSEAERRRAQAPDLFAEPAPATMRAAATSPRWLAWSLAAVVALLLTGWLARGLLSTPTQPAVGEAASDISEATSTRQASSAASSTVPASMPGPQAVAPKPLSVDVEPTTAHAPPSPSAPLPAPRQALPTAAHDVRAADIAAHETTDSPAPRAEPVPLPAEVIAAASTPSTEATLLRLADLSSEERRQLPTLKMSMHLWHAVSAQRFVILDGERMGEGDRIGDAVIDEITRDGVLLAWQGRRLKLPIQ